MPKGISREGTANYEYYLSTDSGPHCSYTTNIILNVPFLLVTSLHGRFSGWFSDLVGYAHK